MLLLVDRRTDDKYFDDEYILTIEKALSVALQHAGYGDDYEISFSIVDEAEIQDLNREYRDHDSVTDVLSFGFYEKGETPESGLLGDIVICAQRAKEQAEEYGHSYERELIYLSVHSLLHLLGYDHEVDDDKNEMRALEKKIMKELEVFK